MSSQNEKPKRPVSLAQFLEQSQPTVEVKRIPHLQDATGGQLGVDQNSGLVKSSPQDSASVKIGRVDPEANPPLQSIRIDMNPSSNNPGLAMSPTTLTNQGKSRPAASPSTAMEGEN